MLTQPKHTFLFWIILIAVFLNFENTSYAQTISTIVVRAAGSLAGNVGPIMQIKVDGNLIATQEVRNASFQNYSYSVANLSPGSRLDVVFTNDAVINGQDRNLLVRSVSVNSVALPIASAIYDLGVGAAAFDGLNVRSAKLFSPYMPWSGALRFKLSSGLTSNQMGLVINDNDPYSVAIGEYYRVKRNIPLNNIVHVSLPLVANLTAAQFAPIKSQIDLALSKDVQAIALAWELPYRVQCNSITSAVSMGFQSGPCVSTCNFGAENPLFNVNLTQPFTQKNVRPSMMLAARTIDQAKVLIDRGLQSDHSHPKGSASLMLTTDSVRSIRAQYFNSSKLGNIISPYLNVSEVNANFIQRPDILFYFQGLANVLHIGESNVYLPGAVADNLTSFGGDLDGGMGQISILDFIAAGATGSFGTVSEPCAYTQKFSDPAILMARYTSGMTLIESYWQSVEQNFQGLFIGDPLANPWQSLPTADTKAPNTLPAPSGYSADTGIKIYWAIGHDDAIVASYKIYRDNVLIATQSASVTTSYMDLNVVNAQTYTYKVTAVDNSGNEGLFSPGISIQFWYVNNNGGGE